jgi:hypothetical protein
MALVNVEASKEDVTSDVSVNAYEYEVEMEVRVDLVDGQPSIVVLSIEDMNGQMAFNETINMKSSQARYVGMRLLETAAEADGTLGDHCLLCGTPDAFVKAAAEAEA